jgi:hypothetical protein
VANTKGEACEMYSIRPGGCHRYEECSASRALNEKVVAAVGMNAGRERGMGVIVPAINKQLVIRIMRVGRDFLPHAH